MSDEIQVGDLVECIDDIDSDSALNTGRHYVVACVHHYAIGSTFQLRDILGDWKPSRFRKIAQPKPNVHCGGPYVARSEYERVCAELEALKTEKPVDTPPLDSILPDVRCVGWMTIDEDGTVKIWLSGKPEPKRDHWFGATWWALCMGEVREPNDWKSCIWRVNTLGMKPRIVEDEA